MVSALPAASGGEAQRLTIEEDHIHTHTHANRHHAIGAHLYSPAHSATGAPSSDVTAESVCEVCELTDASDAWRRILGGSSACDSSVSTSSSLA